MTTLHFQLAGHGPVTFDIDHLIIAGWTGRDMAMVEHHIAELEAIGVARPKSVPTFYRVSASLLSSDGAIEVPGSDSSGAIQSALARPSITVPDFLEDTALAIAFELHTTKRTVPSFRPTR